MPEPEPNPLLTCQLMSLFHGLLPTDPNSPSKKDRLSLSQMLDYDIILLLILFIVFFCGFWFLCVVPAVLELAL